MRVIGIDVDAGAAANPCVDEFQHIRDAKWPVADNSIDLIVCDHVLEHLADPAELFQDDRKEEDVR